MKRKISRMMTIMHLIAQPTLNNEPANVAGETLV